MLKYNVQTQKKLEDIFDEIGYTVRYEKGTFNSGYCVLESKKVVVINKFHTIDAKINSLIEILFSIDFEKSKLSKTSLELFENIENEANKLELF